MNHFPEKLTFDPWVRWPPWGRLIASTLSPGFTNAPYTAMFALAAVFVFFWKLRVEAAIWRQSLEIPVSAAYLLTLTLALLLGEALLLFVLVPAPVPAAP